MLHLRKRVLSGPPLPSTSPLLSLHRLISAAAPGVSPNPAFAVDDYLVRTCGLTRAQALKASAKLSHLKSPANPDAVIAFLAGLGLSGADVAALVARDPQILCAKLERTLAPNVAGLAGLGLSQAEIARFVSLAPDYLRQRSVVCKVEYYLPLFGSIDNLLRPLKYGSGFLGSHLERDVKPKVSILAECGLGACDIAKLFIRAPRILCASTERVLRMVACAERIGVPRGSGMFRQALHVVSYFSEDKIAAKVDYLKRTLGWSDADVGIAVSKAPFLLGKSRDMLKRRSEFLISEVGLQPAYIAHRPALLTYSLEGRLRPRYYVVKFLKENGLLKRDPSYYTIAKFTDKAFVEKCICPHKEDAPQLAEDYAAACKGEVPNSFRFKA
ncbi:transcription termination factor MTERF8, chloroplastic-like [Triticum dicoccoides]|uniref:transcription termination factor MTERF8, chloroplastic-like n=1 Tax=Triticum dicoccoides TaxID=85692 RepID=UPI00189140C5|nr:transcription termination factor MTERF8, chloroplastic-like [Triticum dicoccoides]